MSAPVFVSAIASDAVEGDVVTLTGGEARHAATVQRRVAGEIIEVVDGHGRRVRGAIVGVRVDELDVLVDAVSTDADGSITLVQALAKGGRDELAIETATELGVTRVVPWGSERSIVQWRGPKVAKAQAAWESTVLAAAKQARRAFVPVVADLVTTKELVTLVGAAVGSGERVLVLHEGATTPLVNLRWTVEHQAVWLVVGPEGGISDNEIGALVGAGAESVRLGPHVLRASTAGAAAIAALAAVRGDWAAASGDKRNP